MPRQDGDCNKERTWQDALDDDRPSEAVVLWLMEDFGGSWSTWDLWRDPALPPPAVARSARAFCERHGLDPELAAPEGAAVIWVVAAMVEIIVHLAHKRFGRPVRSWRDNPDEHYVGMEEALMQIERAKEAQARAVRDSNDRQRVRAVEEALAAQRYHDEGMLPDEIAQVMGKHPGTVRRWLRTPIPSLPT